MPNISSRVMFAPLALLSFLLAPQALAQDQAVRFVFKGEPENIRSAEPTLTEIFKKDKHCTKADYGWGDNPYARDAPTAEKLVPRNLVVFTCVKQTANNNSFDEAGVAFLQVGTEFSLELTVTASCCSGNCVTYSCAGSAYTCWTINKRCRMRCSTCNQ